MQNENVQNENVQNGSEKSTPRRGFYRRLSRKARLGILATTLVLAGVMGAAAVNSVLPKPAPRAPSFRERLAWYVQHHQYKADMHTLSSVVRYIVTGDSPDPTTTSLTNLPVARNVSPTPPKS